MSRRAEWQVILEAETRHWSAMTCEQLIAELHEEHVYSVEVESKRYQVEVQLLENTNEYVHVAVSIDDGSLPWSIVPLSNSFVLKKFVEDTNTAKAQE
jgi:hypothetical protein